MDSTTHYTGFTAGLIRSFGQTDLTALGADGALSLSLGNISSETEFRSRWMRSYKSEAETAFAGVAALFAPAAKTLPGLHVGTALRIGRTQFDNRRFVNNNLVFGGIEARTGSTEAAWLTVSGDLGYRVATTDTSTFTGFARISHVSGTVDGYTENGSAAADIATIGGQDIAVTRAEIGLRASAELNPTARFHGSLSAFFSEESGDSSVLVTLGQDTHNMLFAQLENAGMRGSIGEEYGLGNGSHAYTGANWSVSDTGDTDISGSVALRMEF